MLVMYITMEQRFNERKAVTVYLERSEYDSLMSESENCGASAFLRNLFLAWFTNSLEGRGRKVSDRSSGTEAVGVREGGGSKRSLRQRGDVTSGSVVRGVPASESDSSSHPKSRDMADYRPVEIATTIKESHHPRCPCNLCAKERK